MTSFADRFLKPSSPQQRRYEALRAHFVERLPLKESAARFGYSYGTMRNLCAEFKKAEAPYFFDPKVAPEPKPAAPQPELKQVRAERILELRKQNLSIYDIEARLAEEQMPLSRPSIHAVLSAAGIAKLPRRTFEQRARVRPEPAAVADCRKLDLSPRKVRTGFAGLFLFIHDLVRLNLDQIVADCDMPGSKMIPAGHAFRALLALKLWGIGRPSRVMPHVCDEGLALFAGLNASPKRSTLSEYSCRVEPQRCQQLMRRWHQALRRFEVNLGGGRSFDLDFHTVPYHGDEALVEKHYISKRSRAQKGILTLVVRDADARIFCFANARLRKSEQNDAVLKFVDYWQAQTGAPPKELVFDSRFTTYRNLHRLNQKGIAFITVRRRTRQMLAKLLAHPPEQWKQVRLSNVGRAYRTPNVLDQQVQLNHYTGAIRQLTITGLGHDSPTLLLTNQLTTPAAQLIDRYARRMLIENTIEDAINFFHLDALSAAVPLKIDVDLQLTLIASALYRILGIRAGRGLEVAKADSLFQKLVQASGSIEITDTEIIVRIGRRAYNPYLLAADYQNACEPIPWLGDRLLRIEFF